MAEKRASDDLTQQIDRLEQLVFSSISGAATCPPCGQGGLQLDYDFIAGMMWIAQDHKTISRCPQIAWAADESVVDEDLAPISPLAHARVIPNGSYVFDQCRRRSDVAGNTLPWVVADLGLQP
jgi:hypothetical protein